MGTLDDGVSHGMAVIERNVGRLQSLVEDLLVLSAYDADQVRLVLAPCDLAALVAHCRDTLAPAAEAQEVVVEVQAAPGLPLACVDRGQVERALVNVLDNAVKFSHRGGRVVVHLAAEGREVVVRVVDEGVGVPAAEQHRLFTRFYRSSLSVADEVQGTGLGLALVQQVVDWHEGTVAAESVEGRGTTITLRLPRA